MRSPIPSYQPSTQGLSRLDRERPSLRAIPDVFTRRPLPQALTVLGLLVLTVWVFRRQLFDGWSFPWDFLGPYTATPPFVAATFGHGHPLSWSPFVASGFPVDVDPQAGVYFPIWWLLGALRIPATLGVLTTVQVAHVFFGAIGMLLLARARRLSWPWAAMSAVAYIFFGGFYGQAEHADYFRGFSYLPWLLWTLTPPADADGRWGRLVALPPAAWLVASGAYPGQVVSFAILGLLYLSVSMAGGGRALWRKHRTALLLAVLASIGVCVTVLLPHIRAEQAGELFRENEPTASVRSGFSLAPLDVFGLYLSNFAWTYEGTIAAWAVGVPTIVGLALARKATLRAHRPLIVCALAALALAMTPKIGFVGDAMASLRFLFPSRFPAADYKAAVAIALILVSADAWARNRSRRDAHNWLLPMLAGCVLVGGALLVPSKYAQPTDRLWLLVIVVVASVGLALLRPRSVAVLACALIVLLVIDGTRETKDYRLANVASPWQVPPAELSFYLDRDSFVRELPSRLEREPASRPERTPAVRPQELNASGWVADSYHESDYDTTIERVRLRAQNNPAWLALLQARWYGFTFPCSVVGCRTGHVDLPAVNRWHVSPYVHTTSYGASEIAYAVDVPEPMLLVENELAVRGWHANTSRVHAVSSDLPFRAWSLSPGRYRFTATFQEPGRPLQYAVLAVALIAWLGAIAVTSAKGTSIDPKGYDD